MRRKQHTEVRDRFEKLTGFPLNQKKLAQATNLTQAHISLILARKRNPSLDVAVRLAAALGLSLDVFQETLHAK